MTVLTSLLPPSAPESIVVKLLQVDRLNKSLSGICAYYLTLQLLNYD